MRYTCARTGNFMMSVLVNSVPIAGGPWAVHVRSGSVSASGSRASGGVLEQASVAARVDASFELAVVDAQQNPIEGDDAHVSVQLNGTALLGVNATYLGPAVQGQYRVVLPLTRAGDNTLTILVNNQPISDAVRHVVVTPAAASNATTTADGAGLSGGDTEDILVSACFRIACFDPTTTTTTMTTTILVLRCDSARSIQQRVGQLFAGVSRGRAFRGA